MIQPSEFHQILYTKVYLPVHAMISILARQPGLSEHLFQRIRTDLWKCHQRQARFVCGGVADVLIGVGHTVGYCRLQAWIVPQQTVNAPPQFDNLRVMDTPAVAWLIHSVHPLENG